MGVRDQPSGADNHKQYIGSGRSKVQSQAAQRYTGRSKVHSQADQRYTVRPLKGTKSGYSKVHSLAAQRHTVRPLKDTKSVRSIIFLCFSYFFYFFKIQRNTLIEFPLKVILFQSVYMPFVCLFTYTFISACSRTCKRRTCS